MESLDDLLKLVLREQELHGVFVGLLDLFIVVALWLGVRAKCRGLHITQIGPTLHALTT